MPDIDASRLAHAIRLLSQGQRGGYSARLFDENARILAALRAMPALLHKSTPISC